MLKILQSVQDRSLGRKMLLSLVVLAMALVVVACGGAEEPAATDATTEEAIAEATTAPDEEAATTTDETTTNNDENAEEAASDETGDDTIIPRPEVVSEGSASDLQPLERNAMYDAPPEMTIDPSKYYYATFKTDKGDIKAQLFAARAPETVNNFVFLAQDGYFNDTVFHRVLEDFMAQAGDPTGTGTGGPGYQFADEFDPSLAFDRGGLLAMANAGPGTNGSQFFLTFGPTEWLNNRHTIFGEIIEGTDVLNSLTLRDPNTQPGFAGDMLYTVLIEETDESILPPPPPPPTPFAPSSLDSETRPLATLEPAERAGYFNEAPETVIDTSKSYEATVTTSKGDLVVTLYDDEAPTAVNNFVLLARLGFYDNTPVNQITPELVIIGSPDNTPSSDAGYRLSAEVNISTEMAVGLVGYVPYQAPVPTSSSSQLLLALIAPPIEANANFSFFGQITSGAELLAELTTEDTIESIIITEE